LPVPPGGDARRSTGKIGSHFMNSRIGKDRVPTRKKRGIWVFWAGAPLTASVVKETIDIIRNEREQQVLGRKRNPPTKAQ